MLIGSISTVSSASSAALQQVQSELAEEDMWIFTKDTTEIPAELSANVAAVQPDLVMLTTKKSGLEMRAPIITHIFFLFFTFILSGMRFFVWRNEESKSYKLIPVNET